MQCAEFENRLNEVLDERRSAGCDALLRTHARRCGECRRLMATYELACDAASQLPLPKPRRDLAQRVMADLVRQPVARPQMSPASRRQMAASVFALAAALLIVVFPLLRTQRPADAPATNPLVNAGLANSSLAQLRGDDPRQQPSENATSARSQSAAVAKTVVAEKVVAEKVVAGQVMTVRATPAKAIPVIAPAPRDVETPDASEPYADLAKETGHGLATAMLRLPGFGGSLATGDIQGFEQPSWVLQVSDGLRPLTSSMSGALDVLLRAIPSAASQSPDEAS